ncbi:MAG: FAD-dependent oxidoreductase [Alphaproteobacteria bacterium]|nr:FAD-dependent oxidoreductase [Alphaproteobacteria bacterium]
MKIAVIGAGIMGLSAAHAAHKHGFDVTLYERQKGFPKNASSIAGGMLAPFSEIEALPMPYIEEGIKSIGQWRVLLGETNIFKQNGSLLIAHKEDKHMLHRFAQHLGYVADKWKWEEARSVEPALQARFDQGVFIESEAYLEPQQTMQLLRDAIKESIRHQEVEPQEIESQYDWVIDCRGYRNDVQEMRGVKGEILLVENKEFSLKRPVRLMHPRYPLYIIPRDKHIFAIGASVIENGDDSDNRVFLRSAMELMSAAYSLHPSFGEAHIIDIQSAVRPAYQNNLPRIDYAGGKVIRCNGLFRHGYLFAPVMAESVMSWISDKENTQSIFWHKVEQEEVAYAS